MISIRAEMAEDYKAISEVNRAAFGGESEVHLVRALRETPAFMPALSLVAVTDGCVVGHILFSIVHIACEGELIPVIALAPMAVLPAHQNKGIGSLLVREGLNRCRELGHSIVVVVGHPNYYPRFGFTPAGAQGLKLPFEAPDEAFMALELVPGALDGLTGEVVYPPEFSQDP